MKDEEMGGKLIFFSVHTSSNSTLPRGMQCTMYVKMAPGVTVDQLRAHLAATYASEPFVKVWGLCGEAGCSPACWRGGGQLRWPPSGPSVRLEALC